ncbi:tRNA lysidine(34) synthetase TilS [Candidatus Saccharibacteria bacterium]|nr:tRNA lysidine(34) synthetase TilS [Candidatus Saccharibacteria bacterium]
MRVDLEPGKYVIAVSGGVDSMVLLDILAKQAKSQELKAKSRGYQLSANSCQLVVAHFNHGIRKDSNQDEELVRQSARKYSLSCEVGYGNLGKDASEETARQARYAFLEKIKKQYNADAIITAHHQDDLIETAFLNILRGTGRLGLSSIRSRRIVRPLLHIPKRQILNYAKKKKLNWREDQSNVNTNYLRNYLRVHIIPKLTAERRTQILQHLDEVAKINQIIDKEIAIISQKVIDGGMDRKKFALLPTEVGEEVLMDWLRRRGLAQFDRTTVKRVGTAIKTARPHTVQPIYGGWQLQIGRRKATLKHL